MLIKEVKMKKEEIINKKLEELKKSKFRSSFKLRKYMISYIDEKGMHTLTKHAYEIIIKNISSASPINDGKQTPTKNHPVFIAQHACACCCRSCLEKWHHIPKGRKLTNNEINYIVALITEWIKREYKNQKNKL